MPLPQEHDGGAGVKPVQIHESFWKANAEQMCEYKHFWAFKNGKVFVAVATKTTGLRFIHLPVMRGQTMELEFTEGAIASDEIEARNKVVQWLLNQS